MTPRWQFWGAVVLFFLVMGAALYFPSLRRQVDKAKTIERLKAKALRLRPA